MGNTFIAKTTRVLALSVLFLAAAVCAEANVINGSLWHVPEAVALNAVPANIPASAPDVTFDVNSPLNFFGNGVTVGTWLSNGSASNIVENTAGSLASLMDDGVTGTLLEFTGIVLVTNGQVFTVTHDNGLTLIIGGIDLGFSPGPTPPTIENATYNGPSGFFPFQLVYAECCTGSAVLQIEVPGPPFSNVPEPGTLALFGLGLASLGFARRKRLM